MSLDDRTSALAFDRNDFPAATEQISKAIVVFAKQHTGAWDFGISVGFEVGLKTAVAQVLQRCLEKYPLAHVADLALIFESPSVLAQVADLLTSETHENVVPATDLALPALGADQIVVDVLEYLDQELTKFIAPTDLLVFRSLRAISPVVQSHPYKSTEPYSWLLQPTSYPESSTLNGEDASITPESDLLIKLITDPVHIPHRPAAFVGFDETDETFQALFTFLFAYDRVLLQGCDGIGKTTLASELARFWLSQSNKSVLWVRAGKSSFRFLWESLAHALNISASVVAEQRHGLLNETLEKSSIGLIVLDGIDNERIVRQLQRVIPATIKLLVTSHHTFSGFKVQKIRKLSRDASLQLLNFHAKQPLQDDLATHELCELADDNPFNLRLAGLALAESGLLPAELLVRLKNSIAAAGSLNDMAAAFIKTSLDLLDNVQVAQYFTFSAFQTPNLTSGMVLLFLSGCDCSILDTHLLARLYDEIEGASKFTRKEFDKMLIRAALRGFIARNTPQIEAHMDQLVKYGLIEREPATDSTIAYYHMHSLAYHYARQTISNQHEDRVITACTAYITAYSGSDSGHALALASEIDSLMAVGNIAMKHKHYLIIDQMVKELYSDNGILVRFGLHSHGAALAKVAYEGAGQLQISLSPYLLKMGYAARYRGRWAEAHKYYQAAIAHARTEGNQRKECFGRIGQGNVYILQKKFKSAMAAYREALEIPVSIKDVSAEAEVMDNFGALMLREGDAKQALLYFARSLTIQEHQDNPDKVRLCQSYLKLARCYETEGDEVLVLELAEKAQRLSHQIGITAIEGRAYLLLTKMHKNLNNADQAIECARAGLSILRQTSALRAELMEMLGVLYFDMQSFETAAPIFYECARFAGQIGDTLFQAQSLNRLSACFRHTDRYEEAIAAAQQAATSTPKATYPDLYKVARENEALSIKAFAVNTILTVKAFQQQETVWDSQPRVLEVGLAKWRSQKRIRALLDKTITHLNESGAIFTELGRFEDAQDISVLIQAALRLKSAF